MCANFKVEDIGVGIWDLQRWVKVCVCVWRVRAGCVMSIVLLANATMTLTRFLEGSSGGGSPGESVHLCMGGVEYYGTGIPHLAVAC